jgi:hypothetical protein
VLANPWSRHIGIDILISWPRVGAFILCGSHKPSRLPIRPAELGDKPGPKVTITEPRLDREKFAPDPYFKGDGRLGHFNRQPAYPNGRSFRVGNDPRIEVAVSIAPTSGELALN